MGANLKRTWIIDVECTCWDTEQEQRENVQEVIEVGLARLDLKTRSIERFDSRLVKPQQSRISPFCTHLTGWKEGDLEFAPSFAELCKRLRDEGLFQSGDTWWSCGMFDKSVLVAKPISLYGIHPNENPFARLRSHFNVKTLFAMKHRLKKEIGLGGMLATIGETFEGRQHNGADDAYNIAKIVRHIIT